MPGSLPVSVSRFARCLPSALALSILLGGCGGEGGPGTDPTTPAPGVPAALVAVGGSSVGGTVGEPVSTPLRVQLRDAAGDPVAGIPVQWSLESGGGSVVPEGSGTTNAAGEARAQWTLGTGAGLQEVEARVGSLSPVRFAAQARAGPPATLSLVNEPASRATSPGSAFPDPVRVRLLDAWANPVSDAPVEVAPESGGWTHPAAPRTDAQGEATLAWYAGPAAVPGSGTPAGLNLRVGALEVAVEGEVVPAQTGLTLLGHRAFVEYTPGTLPLVLTAPHGGTLRPADLPDRTVGTTVRDLDTDRLAQLVADSLEALSGERPHLIRVLLHRIKLDANREVGEAAQGNPEAVRGWEEFHSWTEAAMAAVRQAAPRGLYLDLHGHGHEVQRLELGYLLSGAELALDDAALNAPQLAERSSLREVAAWTGRTPAQVLRGEGSLGDLFHRQGYPAVPSPQDPHPAGAPYFSGGYNTRRYGCAEGGTICGFQLEANRIGVRDSEAALGQFAGATARVLLEFLAEVGGGSP